MEKFFKSTGWADCAFSLPILFEIKYNLFIMTYLLIIGKILYLFIENIIRSISFLEDLSVATHPALACRDSPCKDI